MGLFTVYKLTAPNGKVYIGITSRKPEYRWNHGKGYYQNKHLYSAILRYGWDNFKHEIIVDNISKETACALERQLIAMHKSNDRNYGYNNSDGGESPNKGHKASQEEIKKRVEKIKSKPMSEKGRKHISEAKKGKPNGLTGRTGKQCKKSGLVYQIDRETNETVYIYYGFSEMARMTGFARTPVQEAANGKRNQAYGFQWKYERRE